MDSSETVLARFSPPVAGWFTDVFAAPTGVQAAAWEAISSGDHALIVAPTGSGKTLAAFLWALDRLTGRAGQTALDTGDGPPPAGRAGGGKVSVLYISPLKALGVDVDNNLRAPLTGIARTAARLGADIPPITTAVRSGDTPPNERRKQQANPPDILITTPESLYLLLTSKAAAMLTDVEYVIVDEIHAVAGTKRGVHLALSLERLERLCGQPFQRIGLSATVRPVEQVAGFLGGDRPVTIINPPADKQWQLDIHVPVDDMADIPSPEPGSTIGDAVIDDTTGLTMPPDGDNGAAPWDSGHPEHIPRPGDGGQASAGGTNLDIDFFTGPPARWSGADPAAGDPGEADTGEPEKQDTPGGPRHSVAAGAEDTPAGRLLSEDTATSPDGSIWPFVEQDIYAEIMAARSVLLFVNSRRTAEKLTSRLNELWASEHDPSALNPAGMRLPAQLGTYSDTAGHARAVIARAHHGSVSKTERSHIEAQLKSGELRCVVATSSLELGIDMGMVDKVIQVQAPPSVASGLQRVGRAGHTVGAVSHGSFYPLHRSDLVATAVTVERMREGAIEALTVPENPLDVLVQQTIATTVTAPISTDQWYAAVRRSWPYRNLPRDIFDAVIDLAAGVYPSTDFSELKPRIIHDPVTGELSARPGTLRVAVTNGGTIPDRGMFGVFLAGGATTGQRSPQPPRRVGELDEEMVYESRVGDVFTLGASSWRIEEITKDQVLVTPAPGHTGRLPFWNGDSAGRPCELGTALGAYRREVAADPARADTGVLDERARNNLLTYLGDQKDATGIVPDDTTLLLERFTDELGDWRIVLHSPFGRPVNAAWALAVNALIGEKTGMDAQAVAGDDGIVLRLPDQATEPGQDLFVIDPDQISDIVAGAVGDSALFASRFRECAARALLLPRKKPGTRAPLWQQRQRAAQLLDVARKYPKFPIILETVRECLKDVYDIPALEGILGGIARRQIRIAEVTVDTPSPFASSLLFNYTGAFMYEGDSPLAEKRAAALALDPVLLAKLLGTRELAELLDGDIIDEVHRQLRRTAPDRRATTCEQLADTLRIVGPVPVEELGRWTSFAATGSLPADTPADSGTAPDSQTDQPVHHPTDGEHIADIACRELGNRVMRVRIAGKEHLAQSLDAPLLRDGLGIPVPPGVVARQQTITDALDQLVGRYAKTSGPFTVTDVADHFGIAPGAAFTAISRQIALGAVTQGRFRSEVTADQYCAGTVLSIIRSRCLARARAQAEPVSQSTFARFLPDWHRVAPAGDTPRLRGTDGVFAVIEQLAGVRLPASAWESLVLPARVGDYQPSMLDELTNSGEVFVVGCGKAGAKDPWIMLLPADYAAQLAPPVDRGGLTDSQEDVLELLDRGGGFYFPQLLSDLDKGQFRQQDPSATDSGPGGRQPDNGGDRDPATAVPEKIDPHQLQQDLWTLVERGLVTPDGFGPIRARLAGATGGKAAHRATRRPARGRLRMGRTSFAHSQQASPAVSTPVDMTGRWARAVIPATDATTRSIAHGEAWLDRYGVVTRGSVKAEDVTGGFALAYKVLTGFEQAGKAMRGYLVDGLGAAQFSTPALIDRLRGFTDSPDVVGWPSGAENPQVHVLAATDPANPFGAALPWPDTSARPTRAPGAVVVIADGLLVAYLTRGGKNLTLFDQHTPLDDSGTAAVVVTALTDMVAAGRMSKVTVEKIDGQAALQAPVAAAMKQAGASFTPRGIVIGGPSRTTPLNRPRLKATTVMDNDPAGDHGDGITDPGIVYRPPKGTGFRRPGRRR
ncbi:DEAD/DEAH box helicase [Corynebacterium mendelii]|uniref:DEAD/DEAH box helicase n=1 Tax=Corynebacterium mendelii TaxID=2765362 RepID=A0A939E1G1_9CORY|nr:DEAD/DEAH box helicase [Corynebacterium mendelii]MBN9644684.1 DEAD/DEAH box helicase [Corynebacterium mendelii]